MNKDSQSQLKESFRKNELEVFTPFIATCFVVNYTLGVGFLGIPQTVYQAGWLLTLVAVFFIVWIAYISCNYLVESLARLEEIVQIIERRNGESLYHPTDIREGMMKYVKETHLSLMSTADISTRRFELSECVEILWGQKNIYLVSFAFLIYATLWSYTGVFASSTATAFSLSQLTGVCKEYSLEDSECMAPYRIYVLIYGVIAILVTLMELKDQKFIQVVLTWARILMFSLILVLSIVQIFMPADKSLFGQMGDQSTERKLPSAYNLRYFGPVLANTIMGTTFQMCVPIITQHIINKPVNTMKSYKWGCVVIFLCLCFLGLSVSTAFGANTRQLCTGNWTYFTGGQENTNTWWVLIIKYLIVLFPSISVIATFPISAITLADNLMLIFHYDDAVSAPKKVKIIFRLVSAIPPLIGSLFVRNMRVIFNWTGLVCFIPCLILPPLLNLKTRRIIPKETHYDSYFSHPFVVRGILIFGIGTFIYQFLYNAGVF